MAWRRRNSGHWRLSVATFGDDDAELSQQTPQLIGKPRVVGDSRTSATMDDQNGLLLRALDRDKPHGRSPGGFADGSGIVAVVFDVPATLPVGCHETGIDDARIMPQVTQGSCPVMGARAGLHGYNTGRQIAEERQQLGTSNRPFEHDMLTCIDAAQGESVFGQINTNTDDRIHGSPRFNE